MRPVKLTLSAFGPFAGTEVIEFDKLGENPLFLINGPTGSGKTTILDGICFALYGRTTGDEREAALMRCDAATPDLLTRVELIFKLQDKTWRISREPEQLRPKGRGQGLTTHQPRAELYSRDAYGKESVVVASKVTEARAAIEELTGLNIEQFRQVMVLPQGEFRNLLMAKSTEREKVFSHLFQTQIYSRIEVALKNQASDVRKQLEASLNQQKGILHSADLESEAQLVEDLENQAALLKISTEQKAKALSKKQQADAALIGAQKTVADFERLEKAKTVLNLLGTQAEEFKALEDRLSNARLALRIQPRFDQWQAAIRPRGQAEQTKIRVEDELSVSQTKAIAVQAELKAVVAGEPDIEVSGQRKSQLEAYRGRLVEYESATLLSKNNSLALERSTNTLELCNSTVREKQIVQEGLLRQQLQLLEGLKGLGDLRLENRRLEELYQKRTAWEQGVCELHECESEVQEKVAARIDAKKQLKKRDQLAIRLELAWHAGQAVVLAEKLEKNQPCPVCGSEFHPEPAKSDKEIPGEDVRQEAAVKVAQAYEELAKLDTAIAGLETRRVHLKQAGVSQEASLGPDIDGSLAAVKSAQDANLKAIESLEKDQLQEQRCVEQLSHLIDELAIHQANFKQAELARAKAATKVEVAQSEMRSAEKELPETYRISGKLESEISRLETELSIFKERKIKARQAVDASGLAIQAAETNRDNATLRLDEARTVETVANDNWRQLLTDSPFADEAGFHQSRLKDDQVAKLEERIQQHATTLDQAKGAVNTLAESLSNQAKPELQIFEIESKQAGTDFAMAEAGYTDLDKRVSRLRDIVQKLEQSKSDAQALENNYAVIGTLADTATGKTGNRVSLQRFVLSVLLDDVLTEASLRFKRMSKGRYALYRHQEKGKGGGASGLELLVDDAYSGKQRPVATLSGGESFMAALSLALGLSDVVQAYAGGIKLDTLFIDEGFGSLDAESLDLAVNTLIDLQSSGRMVGIISHVPELKERINVRLDVIADRKGSHTRTALA